MYAYADYFFRLILADLFLCTALVLASGGGAEDNNRLLDTIFQGYKPATLPRLNDSRPIDVQVGMGVIAVVDLDTRSQVLHLRGYARVFWTDELLRWDPEHYGNITYVILSEQALWRPDITLINSLQENIYMGNEEGLIWLNYDGAINWQPAFNSKFTCQVDVVKYPTDVNICIIKIGVWMHDNSHVNLSISEPHMMLEYDVNNGQFDIAIAEATKRTAYYDGDGYDDIYFRLKLSRKPAYVILSLLLPVFVIGLLNIVSFLIPADHEGKVDLSLNIMLATTVLINMVQDDLPDRSDKIASVAVYVISLFVLAFFGVLGNTIVQLVHRQEEFERAEDYNLPVTAVLEENTESIYSMEAYPFPRPLFDKPPIMAYTMSKPETPVERNTPSRLSRGFCCAHVMAGSTSNTKAARLNFRFLVGSALCLAVCSLILLIRIIMLT